MSGHTPSNGTGILLLAATVAMVASAASAQASGARSDGNEVRPNIIIVLCDDLGYGDLGCYGSPVIRTPNLDRFAAEGVRFTACYAAGANCSPARAGLLTGRTPYRIGIYDTLRRGSRMAMRLREEELTVAELLRAAGYETYHGGKWHLSPPNEGTPDAPAPLAHGFDHSTRSLPAGQLFDDLVTWIDGREVMQRPFFAYLALREPHEPLRAAPRFQRLYKGTESEEAARRLRYGRVPRPDEARWEYRKTYFGAITEMDWHFGELMAALDERGLRENTFILFTSDNGPEHRTKFSFGSPGPLRGAKGHVYEGGVRVPGIIRWPGHASPGVVCDEPINATDVLPTLCVIGGADVPSDRTIDGVSILPTLEGRTLERPVPLYWAMWDARGGAQYAMRIGDWKILASTPPLPKDRRIIEHINESVFVRYELYNLRQDIAEETDLAAMQPAFLARMKAAFLSLHGDVLAEGPDWDLEEQRVKARNAWPDAYGIGQD